MFKYPSLKKLSDICKIKTGKKDVNEGNPNGKFPFFTCAREHTFSDSYSFDMEALLIAGNGDVGHVQYYKGKFEAYQRTYILHDFSSTISVQYLFLYLNSFLKETVSRQKLGNTMPYIKLGMLTEYQIPLPPLSVQEKIVAKLDAALVSIDEAKTKTQQALAATRELWESTLEEAFRENNGEVKKLGELGQITSSKRIYKKEYVKNGIPFYRIKEIKELAHDKDISIELYISNDRYNEIKETFGIPQEGDLLMTAVGTIGEIYTVKKDDIFYFKDGNVLWFRKFNSINPHFLKLILLSFVENIKKLSIGSAYNALTIEKLENYTISIPSLSKQSRIVAHLDAVRAETDRLAALYEQKLADLDELRRSVLQEAFA